MIRELRPAYVTAAERGEEMHMRTLGMQRRVLSREESSVGLRASCKQQQRYPPERLLCRPAVFAQRARSLRPQLGWPATPTGLAPLSRPGMTWPGPGVYFSSVFLRCGTGRREPGA